MREWTNLRGTRHRRRPMKPAAVWNRTAVPHATGSPFSVLVRREHRQVVQLDIVAGAIPLGGEIAHVLDRRTTENTSIRHDLETCPPESDDFLRIVGHDPDRRHAELLEHL